MNTLKEQQPDTNVHNISNVITYPNHHFGIFTPSRLQLHSNVDIKEGELIRLGKSKFYTIIGVKKVKPSNPDMIKESADTLIVGGEVLNPRYKIGVTKFYTLEVKEGKL